MRLAQSASPRLPVGPFSYGVVGLLLREWFRESLGRREETRSKCESVVPFASAVNWEFVKICATPCTAYLWAARVVSELQIGCSLRQPAAPGCNLPAYPGVFAALSLIMLKSLTRISAIAALFLAGCTTRTPPAPPPASTPSIGPASCSIGQEWCQGRCIDTITYVTDSQNCGRCGNQCSPSETCSGGFCVCAPGFDTCMGRCVSIAAFMSDSQNCGRCGNSCAADENCVGGMCRKL